MSLNIVAITGSLKKDSLNKNLLNYAASRATKSGAKITFIDLNDYPMPLLSEDIERDQGAPTTAKALRKVFANADGILVASPEYNGSISGALKNAIDWLSRPSSGKDLPHAFREKIVGLMSASPGALGGLRGLNHAKDIFYMLGSWVLPTQIAVGGAHQIFDDIGNILDQATKEKIDAMMDAFVSAPVQTPQPHAKAMVKQVTRAS